MKRFILLLNHDDISLSAYLQHCMDRGEQFVKASGNVFTFRKKAPENKRIAAVTYFNDDPDLKMKFQIDCFWSTNKGTEDAVAILKKYADRTILLHMKDGVCKQNAANGGMVNGLLDMKIDLLPLGTGTLPIKDLIAVMPEQVETVIVELDYCNIDMTEAIAQSYRYMVQNGLAAGNK